MFDHTAVMLVTRFISYPANTIYADNNLYLIENVLHKLYFFFVMERNRVVRRINRIKENNNDLGFAIVDKTILKIFFIKMFGVFKFGEKHL